MPIGGIIAGVGALAGGILGGNAAENAAQASANASRRASDVQLQMYNQTREDLAPQREAQRYALDALLSMTGLPALSPMKSTMEVPVVVPPSQRSLTLRNMMNAYSGRPRSARASAYDSTEPMASGEDRSAVYDYRHPKPEGRAFGGPMTAGQQYRLSELGHMEAIRDSGGRLRGISTQPQTITAPFNGSVEPLGNGFASQTSLSNVFNPPQTTTVPVSTPINPPSYQGPEGGIPIPGSSVLENPGGQPGRYNFMADPGYGFRFDEGLRAIERSASARGMNLSGGILKALTRYGQGTASQEYGNVYNRLSNIAGLGQTGQSLTAQAGMNSANQQGGYLQNIGNSQAAGTLGRASVYGDTLSQLGRLYGQGAFDFFGNSGSGTPSDYGASSGYSSGGREWNTGTYGNFGEGP